MSTQEQTGIVGLMLALLIAAIVALEVVLPVIQSAIADAGVTGTTATVLGLIPMFLALLLLVSVASPLMRRV